MLSQHVEAKALQQLFQLNDQSAETEAEPQTGDPEERSSSYEPTYVVIKDDEPVVLKPWSRTPTPSLLLRRSRPQSSLEKWSYNEVDKQEQKEDMAFKKMFQHEIKQLRSNNGSEHVYAYVNDTFEKVSSSNGPFEVYLKATQNHRSMQQPKNHNFLRPHAPTPAASLRRRRASPRRDFRVNGRSTHSEAVPYDTFTLQHCEDSVGLKYMKEYVFFATLASNGKHKFQQVLKQCKHYLYFQKVWADCIETGRPRRSFEHRLMKDVISTDRFCVEFSLKKALRQVQSTIPCTWAMATMSNFDVDLALQNYYNPLEKYTSYRKQDGFSRFGTTETSSSKNRGSFDDYRQNAPDALRVRLRDIRFQCKNLINDHEMSFWLGRSYRILQPILSIGNLHLLEYAVKKLLSGSYEVIEAKASHSRPWGRKIRIAVSDTSNIISGSGLPYPNAKVGYHVHGWLNLHEKCELHLVRKLTNTSTGDNSTSHRFSVHFYPGVTVLVCCKTAHQPIFVRRYRLRGNVEDIRQTKTTKMNKSKQNHTGVFCLSKNQKMLEDIRSRLKYYAQQHPDHHGTNAPGSNQTKFCYHEKAKTAPTSSRPRVQNSRTKKYNRTMNWRQPSWLPDPFFKHRKTAMIEEKTKIGRPSTTSGKGTQRTQRKIDVIRPTSGGCTAVASCHRPKQAKSIRIISPTLNLLKKTSALKKTKADKRHVNIFSNKIRAKKIVTPRMVEIENGTMPLSLTVKTLAMG